MGIESYNTPPAGNQDEIEQKWGVTYEEMDACEVRLDESDPEVPHLRGIDPEGRNFDITKHFGFVGDQKISDEEVRGFYDKYFKILSAKIDRAKAESDSKE